MKCASTNCPMDSGEYVLCEYHRRVASLGEKITVSGVRLSGRGITEGEEELPQVTHHCPGCEAAARELADLKSDKAWADKLSAENADELSNLRREHDDLRARLAALLSARTPPYVSEIECNAYARGRADVLEELRALLAETEGK